MKTLEQAIWMRYDMNDRKQLLTLLQLTAETLWNQVASGVFYVKELRI